MTIASIDIGTNTVLLLIASVDPKTKNLNTLQNEYRMPRIGKNLKANGDITFEKVEALLEVLQEYKTIIDRANANKVLVTATNAFRIARNSEIIKNKIIDLFHWDVNVISGETEARYAYLGAATHQKSKCVVIDIGGGSSEVIIGHKGNILYRKSFPMGCVNATEKYLTKFPVTSKELDKLKSGISKQFYKLKSINAPKLTVAIAGTPTTLACMVNDLREYDESRVEGTILSKEDVEQLCEILAKMIPLQIKERYKKIMLGREDIILSGCIILLEIMKLLDLEQVIVSSKGIRYGAIIDYMGTLPES
jgi:exopolyphosphatase / guanosine-5'-triphosphate,3'-diphosphate pyrophosphatase